MARVLSFEEEGHIYKLDGEPRGSVTQIMQAAGLIDYSRIPKDIRERAMKRGRIVHKITELYDKGRLDESSVDEKLAGYFEAYRKFRTDTGFVPELIEHAGYNLQHGNIHEGLYCGKLDRAIVGSIPKAKRKKLVDIKTGIYEEWVAIQTAAYAAFFPDPRNYDRFCVELHKDGTYALSPEFLGSEWLADMNVFISALNIYNWKLVKGGLERNVA